MIHNSNSKYSPSQNPVLVHLRIITQNRMCTFNFVFFLTKEPVSWPTSLGFLFQAVTTWSSKHQWNMMVCDFWTVFLESVHKTTRWQRPARRCVCEWMVPKRLESKPTQMTESAGHDLLLTYPKCHQTTSDPIRLVGLENDAFTRSGGMVALDFLPKWCASPEGF